MKRHAFTADQLRFIEGMRQPFVVCQFIDRRVEALALSDGFCELFGYRDRPQAYSDMNQNMYKDVHPDDAARFTSALLHFATEGGRLEVIYRTRKKDGSGYMVIHVTGEHVYPEDGTHLAHIWYTEEGDYSDGAGSSLSGALNKALHEASIVKANRYDYLTGLPNMSYFFELAEVGRQNMVAQGGAPALLYIDLSGMKYYNHKYGFAEGDKLLQAFSKLLSNIFHTENCCHIGADRFAAFADENGLEALLERLFREWLEMNVNRHLPICVGIYPPRMDGVPVGMAYDRAKIACDAIKNNYASSFNYYSEALNEGFVKRQYILDNFDRALSERWIHVYYQPIMRAITMKVCNEEALARWIDPVRGFLAPADFIPYLEDAGLIHKLDLYVLDRVLENIKAQQAEGLYTVPHSINLSRSDFDACDMVEEIRRRVDAAGVSRGVISIEITESVIGSDFDFIKAQVERFQALGFPVWMDDFGSGYSSLDVLQSTKFDLLKFDMNFMRKLDESRDGRIILTELMKMALALGVDTVCEGVETEEQSRFLQEIGCSKLQGFYFSRPMPFEHAMAWHLQHRTDGYENPKESAYYESICGVNLYDLGVIAKGDESTLQNAYNTLPMGIIEIKDDSTRFMRTNQSYRTFFKRFFGLDLSNLGSEFVKYDAAFMYNVVRTCCERGLRAFYDEKMPDGSIVHSFARKISTNPVSGNIAIAVAVLSISGPAEGETYVDIARALAADYYCMYMVDMDTGRYIEYSSTVGGQEMAMERHGEDFFETIAQEPDRVYEEDREAFFATFNRTQISRVLDEQGVFTVTCRLMDTGVPVYVNMKATRLQPGGSRIIIGVSVIDAQMKQKARNEALQRERAALVRVMALSDGYLSLYTVNPETGYYVEYTSSDEYAALGAPKEGDGFFRQLVENAARYLYPQDQAAFLARFSREKVLRAIDENGYYCIHYRIMMGGAPRPVVLRIAPFQDGEKMKLLVGVRAWKERQEKPME